MSQEERIDKALIVVSKELKQPVGKGVYTRAHVFDANPAREYVAVLIGPLYLALNEDVRLWVVDRELDGRRIMTWYLQDQDDDVLLNSTAEGVQQYRPGSGVMIDG